MDDKPISLPFAANSKTSKKAAQEMRERVVPARLRIVIEHWIVHPDGLTCDEIEQRLGMSHQSASARHNDLVEVFKSLVDSGKTRKTRSGRAARVLVLSPSQAERCEAAKASGRLDWLNDAGTEHDYRRPRRSGK